MTFEKWQRNYDCEHHTLMWLRCDKDKRDKTLVAHLWCSTCREYQSRICSMKNYSAAWVTGSENQRTSNSTNYQKVWYKLYSCPNAQNWSNIISLCELSFSLPFSNGRVEQIFSALKALKTTGQICRVTL